MDPNLFHIDGERLAEVLFGIVVLSFLLERALAVLFELPVFLDSPLDRKGGKEAVAVAVAFFVCWYWDFDAISTIILREKTNLLGQFITASVIAGGSKASLKLFKDFLDIQSTAARAAKAAKSGASAPAKPAPQNS